MQVIIIQDQGYISSTYVVQDKDTVKAVLMTAQELDEGQGELYFKAYILNGYDKKCASEYNDLFYADCPEISVTDPEKDKVITLEDMFEELL